MAVRLISVVSVLFLASCASGGAGGGAPEGAGIDGDVELAMPKEIATGEVLVPIDHSASAASREKHRQALEELGADLMAANFRRSSAAEIDRDFPVDDTKVGAPGTTEEFFVGSFRKSEPFVIHLRQVVDERRSRFTASVIWTVRKGPELEAQRDKVGGFCEDLGIWWARNNPFRLPRD